MRYLFSAARASDIGRFGNRRLRYKLWPGRFRTGKLYAIRAGARYDAAKGGEGSRVLHFDLDGRKLKTTTNTLYSSTMRSNLQKQKKSQKLKKKNLTQFKEILRKIFF